MTKSNSLIRLPAQLTQWNVALNRRGDTGTPAASWNRILGGCVPTATALNTYLSPERSLSDSQRESFWRIVAHWRLLSPDAGLDRISTKVAESWEQAHWQALGSGENTGGYGGLLRAEHAKMLIMAAGQQVLASQLLAQPMARQPPVVSQQQTNSRTLMAVAQRMPGTNTARAQPKRKMAVTVCVYKGMTTGQISLLTAVEIRKALSTLKEPSSDYNKTALEARLWTVLQEKFDGFKVTFDYMK